MMVLYKSSWESGRVSLCPACCVLQVTNRCSSRYVPETVKEITTSLGGSQSK